jgi:hypothetical protein
LTLRNTFKAAFATAVLSVGLLGVGAAPAHASTLVCYGGDGCNHQTAITFDDHSSESTWNTTIEWWGPFTVLKLQTDGNFVLYCQGHGSNQAVWATGTPNRDPDWGWGAKVIWQSSGNMSLWQFRLQDPNSGWQPKWVSLTEPPTINDRGHLAVVQADGNFVIWSASGRALWASNTYHACPGTENYWTGYQ